MADQTVLEIKQTLYGDIQTFQCRSIAQSPTEAVILFEHTRALHVEDVTIPAGTVSFGYFWTDRGYNAYHWVTPSGRTIGIYFNVSDCTRIVPGEIRWRDLVVDVLVTPDGHCRVIDQDEIPLDLHLDLLKKIQDALESLLHNHTQLVREIEARTAALWGKQAH